MARRSFTRRLQRAWNTLTGSDAGSAFAPAYKGARTHRGNSDWPTGTRSSKQEIQPSLRKLRARARDLSRNSPYARSFLNLLVTNVIGPSGIIIKSQVRDRAGDLIPAINDRIDAAWREWSQGPVTLDRRLNLVQALSLMLETWATDGEELVRLVTGAPGKFGFALQGIDADLLDERYDLEARPGQNEIRMGVEISPAGVPVGYWPYRYAENHHYTSGPRYFLPAFDPFTRRGDTLHLFIPRRLNQTRGVTWFHPVIETLDGMAGYSEAELFGARIGAASTVLIESAADDVDTSEKAEKATPTSELEVAPGVAYRMKAGDKPHFWEPKHPTEQVGPFLKVMAREVAMGLGAPYYALANDLEATSYSSMRGGEMVSNPLWRWIQGCVIAALVLPVREQWLNAALLSGALELGSIDAAAFREARYRGRGWPYVNPLDMSRADALRLQCGTTSRQRILSETTGEDWYEILEEQAEEQAAAREVGARHGVVLSIDPPQSLAFELAKAEAQGGTDTQAAREQPAGASTDGDGNGAQGSVGSVPETIRRRLLGATAGRK